MAALKTAARSWLFVPATRPERYAKAAASGADRVILDLEDAVSIEAKAAARAALADAELPGGVPLYVRINGATTEWFEADLAVAAKLPLAGILLPKAESAAQLARAAAVLPESFVLVPIVETARGCLAAEALAAAVRVERLAFGALDFQMDTGMRGDGEELAWVRAKLVVVSRALGIAAPIDSVCPSFEDESRIRADAERARRYGFAGKLCIHPKQVAPTHAAFAPSAEELAWARGLMAVLESRPAQEQGAFAYRGEMVDQPVIERARAILAAPA